MGRWREKAATHDTLRKVGCDAVKNESHHKINHSKIPNLKRCRCNGFPLTTREKTALRPGGPKHPRWDAYVTPFFDQTKPTSHMKTPHQTCEKRRRNSLRHIRIIPVGRFTTTSSCADQSTAHIAYSLCAVIHDRRCAACTRRAKSSSAPCTRCTRSFDDPFNSPLGTLCTRRAQL